jgi:predicted pyridoxine 5'-phosphate oxidase superfamily flavin-nucleotide-binding protein
MDKTRSPFHAGEVAMQRAAGVDERMRELGPRVIRDHMPDQHREFFEQLPMLLVGSVDARVRPWASMLCGLPGFIVTPDAQHLRVDALPARDDPLHDHLCLGATLGLLGIEPAARRRNRMNGTVVAIDGRGFELRVDQSFGNCPQYIQARTAQWVDAGPATHVGRREGRRLSAAAAALVAQADTLFIASAAPGRGADVSHRGGKPGFVRVDAGADATVLTLPDFRGNLFFNTLGNITAHPWAGLLVVDHDSGDVLQLTGRASIVAAGPEVEAFAGAQRLLRIEIDEGRWAARALPLRWSAAQFAPQLAATGHW